MPYEALIWEGIPIKAYENPQKHILKHKLLYSRVHFLITVLHAIPNRVEINF